MCIPMNYCFLNDSPKVQISTQYDIIRENRFSAEAVVVKWE